jgi:hypothetical protein
MLLNCSNWYTSSICLLYTFSKVCLMYSFCDFSMFLYSLYWLFSYSNRRSRYYIDWIYCLRYGVIDYSLRILVDWYREASGCLEIAWDLFVTSDERVDSLFSFLESTPISFLISSALISSPYSSSDSKNSFMFPSDSSNFLISFFSSASNKFLSL